MAKLGLEGSFDPKRSGSRGFHEGIFDYGFGGFSTVKKRGKRNSANFVAKRIPEMTSRGIGIDGDAFTGSHDVIKTQTSTTSTKKACRRKQLFFFTFLLIFRLQRVKCRKCVCLSSCLLYFVTHFTVKKLM